MIKTLSKPQRPAPCNCSTCCGLFSTVFHSFSMCVSVMCVRLCVWLQQGWGCSELKPPALWPRWEARIWSYLYPPLPRETWCWSFPPSGEGWRKDGEEREEKERKEVHTGSSLQRKLKTAFLHVLSSWPQVSRRPLCLLLVYAPVFLFARRVSTAGTGERVNSRKVRKRVWKRFS